jgi:hypothetical protein
MNPIFLANLVEQFCRSQYSKADLRLEPRRVIFRFRVALISPQHLDGAQVNRPKRTGPLYSYRIKALTKLGSASPAQV